MKKSFLATIVCLNLLALITLGCGGEQAKTSNTENQVVELNVSAAVSLKDALAEIEKKYKVQNPEVKLLYNLGGSGLLQKQIEQGASADIFISAAAKQMDELEAKGLINKSSHKNIVNNELVLIVPKQSKLEIRNFEDVQINRVEKIAVGDPATVPAGQYGQQVLRKLDIWDKVKEKAVFAKDVRTVLTYVETGNVEAGFVYKTDAVLSDKVKIVAMAPEGSHQPIVYPAAILAGTRKQAEAEKFLAFLTSSEGLATFEKYGFVIVK